MSIAEIDYAEMWREMLEAWALPPDIAAQKSEHVVEGRVYPNPLLRRVVILWWEKESPESSPSTLQASDPGLRTSDRE